MACSSIRAADGGYATAAAMVLSMALALTASAMTALATAQFKDSRAALQRLVAERAVAGVQRLAVFTVLENGKAIPLRWRQAWGRMDFDILAEPETAKLGYAAAATLSPTAFRPWAVDDPNALRTRLAAAAKAPHAPVLVSGLDASPTWKDCAPSVISRFGTSQVFAPPRPMAPDRHGFDWRLGEVWRIRVRSNSGWSDDRLVRFTGNPSRPAAVLERSFSRQTGSKPSCQPLGS